METPFILKLVILHRRKNSDEEVSGEINYPQPGNTTCVSSHIPSIYILVLLAILLFFLLPGWTGWKLFRSHLAV